MNADRCVTCKHFYKPEKAHNYVEMYDNIGICANATMWYGPSITRIFVETDPRIIVENVAVGENFGCVFHEAKP